MVVRRFENRPISPAVPLEFAHGSNNRRARHRNLRAPRRNNKIVKPKSSDWDDVLATILLAIVVVLMVFILARALFLHNSRIEQLESRENATKLQFEELQQKYQEILKQIAKIRAEKDLGSKNANPEENKPLTVFQPFFRGLFMGIVYTTIASFFAIFLALADRSKNEK